MSDIRCDQALRFAVNEPKKVKSDVVYKNKLSSCDVTPVLSFRDHVELFVLAFLANIRLEVSYSTHEPQLDRVYHLSVLLKQRVRCKIVAKAIMQVATSINFHHFYDHKVPR